MKTIVWPVDLPQTLLRVKLSHTTVSRVLNNRNDQFISEATRSRVRHTATAMGYRPNRAARALVTGCTHQIALWMHHLYTSFHIQVVHQVEQQVRRSPYQLMIASLDAETEECESLMQWQVDGCLIFEAVSRVRTLLQGRGTDHPPVVGMGGCDFEGEAMDYVGIDLAFGADAAVRHLVDAGCRRIAYIGEDPSEVRHTAYLRVMEEVGQQPNYIVTPNQKRADPRVGSSTSNPPTSIRRIHRRK